MLVVTEDVVGRPCVEIRQGGAAPADFEKSGGGAVSAAFAANSLHPLFNSAADREGYRLSGQGRQLADNSFGFRVLDG